MDFSPGDQEYRRAADPGRVPEAQCCLRKMTAVASTSAGVEAEFHRTAISGGAAALTGLEATPALPRCPSASRKLPAIEGGGLFRLAAVTYLLVCTTCTHQSGHRCPDSSSSIFNTDVPICLDLSVPSEGCNRQRTRSEPLPRVFGRRYRQIEADRYISIKNTT